MHAAVARRASSFCWIHEPSRRIGCVGRAKVWQNANFQLQELLRALYWTFQCSAAHGTMNVAGTLCFASWLGALYWTFQCLRILIARARKKLALKKLGLSANCVFCLCFAIQGRPGVRILPLFCKSISRWSAYSDWVLQLTVTMVWLTADFRPTNAARL